MSNLHEICRVCTLFQDALAFKFSIDLLKGLRSYVGFKLRVWFPQIFSAPSGETMRQIPKRLDVQERARGPRLGFIQK